MPTTLARLLVEAGLVPQEAADAALRRHVAVGGALDTVLLEDRAVDEARLLEALEAAAGLPSAAPDTFAQLDPKALVSFPFKVADRYGMVPMSVGKRHVDVAVSFPVEKLLLEEISFMLGKDLRPHVAIEVRIRAAIATHYKKPLAARFSNLLRTLGPAPRTPAPLAAAPPPASTPPPKPRVPTAPSIPAAQLSAEPPPRTRVPTAPSIPAAQLSAEPPPQHRVATAPSIPAAQPSVGPPPLPKRPRTVERPSAAPPTPVPEPMPVPAAPPEPPVAARPSPIEVEIVVEPEVVTASQPASVPLDPSSPFATVSIEVEQPLPAPRLSWAEEGPSPFEMDAPPGEEDVRVEDDGSTGVIPATTWEPPLPPAPPPAPPPAAPPPAPPPTATERAVPAALPAPLPPLAPELIAAANAVWEAPPPPPPPRVGPPPLPRRSRPATAEVPIAPNSAPAAPNSAPATAVVVSIPEPPPYPEPPPFPEPPPLEAFDGDAAGEEDVRIEPAPDEVPAATAEALPPSPPPAAPNAPPGEVAAPVEPEPANAADTAPGEEVHEEVADADVEAVEVAVAEVAEPRRTDTRPVTPLSVSVPVLAPPQSGDEPPRRLGAETMERMLVWDKGSTGLGSIESALASADLAELAQQIYGGDDRPFLVAPTDAPPLNIAAARIPVAAAASAEAPARPAAWSLTMARQKLAEAPGRDQIIEVALRFALKSFEFAAALAVKGGTAFGWHALGGDASAEEQVHAVALPLDVPSVLRTVLRARGRYLGPLPDDELTRKLLRDLGRDAPAVALIYPVFVRERAVAFFYADRGTRHVAAARVAEFLLFAQEISTSFERAILNNKRSGGLVRAVAVAPLLTSAAIPRVSRESLTVTSPGPVLAAGEDGPPVSDEVFFDIDETAVEVTRGPRRPVETIIDDLVSPDRRRRLAALAELVQEPAISAPALAARFPGPTAMRRGLVDDLPEPEEIGPVANALVRTGQAAVLHLARLLREGDPDTRFFAVLLVGWMKSGELLPGLFRCLFDPVLEVAAGARASAQQLRSLPDFEEKVARPLRSELSNPDPDRVSAAAKALGRVRDVASIGLLIPLTGHADDRVVAEAADALTLLTKQALGDSPRRWQAWWDANKQRPRLAWLIDGLAHRDVQIRLASIEELAGEANDNLGFFADAPKRDREKAIERWNQWLATRN